MKRRFSTIFCAALALGMGCEDKTSDEPDGGVGPGPGGGDDGGTGDGTTGGTGGDDGADDGGDGDSGGGDPGDDGSTGDGGTGTGTDDGGGFIDDPDGGAGTVECNVWTQDCPDGEKCMPWANDGGSAWNSTKCSPIDANPKQPGDECTVEGNAVSGLDNCDKGAMCWDVDPETNMGHCVAMCTGSEQNPSCEEPGTVCSILNEGTLILCLPGCDPLLQDCANEDVCVINSSGDGFTCLLDASGDAGGYGDPCEYINVCDPGLFCAVPELVPGCTGSQGCCTEFCDLEAENTCAGQDQGQECIPFFEEGMAPPDYEHVGACGIPQ